ncbi:helix-turn-helix transcriptional regulator, partial [Arthrobacter deserti]|nr:helix-turn-helix transcriptional regulator [Arthrobacter deserti]
ALLAEAAASAAGMRVLRTQGIESESPLAFAALHRLLRPVYDGVGRLPARQARALREIFGEEEPAATAHPGSDRFLVFLAALSLLAEAAEQEPVLCVVDDAHWLDEASAATLLFVARRLEAERIALLFAARDGGPRRFDSGELPVLTVAGPDRNAGEALLRERAEAAVPAAVSGRLVEMTGGNPLALMELPGALPTAQLRGEAALPAPLPLTDGVEQVFLDRCRSLSEEAQRLLLVAAAGDSGRLATICRAAALLGAGEEALAAVERSGLLQVAGAEVQLRHPLVRSAIYNAAASADRRRAHGALARAMTELQDAERRVWHSAAAAVEPDDGIAEDLDGIARRAAQRGGHEAAAAAWERSAELTVQRHARARRLQDAGQSMWLAGQPNRARTLAQAARRHTEDPVLLADIDRLRARIEWNLGSVQVGHGILMRAARDVAGVDPERAREMAMIGTALAVSGGDSGIGIEPAGFVTPLQGDEPAGIRCFTQLLLGLD